MSLKYDVFISYSRADRKVAEGLCGYLEANGLRCFIDYRDIPRAAVWARVLPEAIRGSGMMVAVYSDNYNKSMQVERELSIADKSGIPVLPFRLSDVPFEGLKSYYFESINWIDAFPDPERVFGDLLNDILALKTESGQWNRLDGGGKTEIDDADGPDFPPTDNSDDTENPDLEDDYNDGIDAMIHHDYSDVYDLLEESALANYREAQLHISRLINQDNIAFIPRRAWPKLRREADDGNAFAQYLMSLYHTMIEVDTGQAYEYAARSARQGNLFGRYALAKLYDRGLGVERDDSRGIEKIKELERLDFPLAMREVARHYIFGLALRKNPRRGFKILERGIEMGMPECVFELGSRIVYGDKNDVDIDSGRELLRQAYDMGYLPALAVLSYSYIIDYSKYEVIPDASSQKKALDLLRQGIRMNDQKCMENLAFVYRFLSDDMGLKSDAGAAEKWYTKAAELYGKNAASGLGMLYYTGFGEIKEDNVKAWKWLKRAAELYDGMAMHYLGVMCIEGVAPAGESAQDAVHYFDDSLYVGGGAAGDSAIWLYRLFAPKDFEKGFPVGIEPFVDLEGCERSLDKALSYLRSGVNLEDNKCRYLLGCALTDTSRPYSNEIEGLEMLEKAVSTALPCYEAALRLYEMYSDGIGVPADQERAKEYLEMAKENIPEIAASFLDDKNLLPESASLRELYFQELGREWVDFDELGRLSFYPLLNNSIDSYTRISVFYSKGQRLREAWKNLQNSLITAGVAVLDDVTDDFFADASELARIWVEMVNRGIRKNLPLNGITSLEEDQVAILDVAESLSDDDWMGCLVNFVDCQIELYQLISEALQTYRASE